MRSNSTMYFTVNVDQAVYRHAHSAPKTIQCRLWFVVIYRRHFGVVKSAFFRRDPFSALTEGCYYCLRVGWTRRKDILHCFYAPGALPSPPQSQLYSCARHAVPNYRRRTVYSFRAGELIRKKYRIAATNFHFSASSTFLMGFRTMDIRQILCASVKITVLTFYTLFGY